MSIICSKCHGTKVSCEAMVNPNTKEFIHYTDDSFEYGWCDNCGNGQILVDMEETITGIGNAFDEYKLVYGKEPLYAVCRVVFMDDYEPPHSMSFKLSMDVDKEDDDVFYYLPGVEELKSLVESSSNDFLITGFDYFINPINP
jgi:hypothetical protein